MAKETQPGFKPKSESSFLSITPRQGKEGRCRKKKSGRKGIKSRGKRERERERRIEGE